MFRLAWIKPVLDNRTRNRWRRTAVEPTLFVMPSCVSNKFPPSLRPTRLNRPFGFAQGRHGGRWLHYCSLDCSLGFARDKARDRRGSDCGHPRDRVECQFSL